MLSLAVDNSIFKFSLKWENVELMLNFLQNKQKKVAATFVIGII